MAQRFQHRISLILLMRILSVRRFFVLSITSGTSGSASYTAVDVGNSYQASIEENAVSNGNYSIADSSAAWSITTKNVTLSWALSGVVSGYSVEYDRTAHTMTASFGSNGSSTSDEKVYSADASHVSISGYTGNSATNVDDYSAHANFTGDKVGNYAFRFLHFPMQS